MKKLRNITLAFFIGLMSIGTSVAYAFPAPNEIAVISSQQPSVSASVGHITLTVNDDEVVNFYIYSITGQIIKTITISQGSTTVELPRGYYIVKCNYWSKTVIVK